MNQELNNLNQNNLNTQGNNGIPNNQPLQTNESFNTTVNQNVVPNPRINQPTFNSQSSVEPIPSYQQPIIQEPTLQPVNLAESENSSNQNFNSKPSKKINLILIIGIIITSIIVVIGVFWLFIDNSNKTNNLTNDKGSSLTTDIVYYDGNRDLKDIYTFDEAVSKFAFNVNETTLIFEENEKVALYSIDQVDTISGELNNPQFSYKHDDFTIVYNFYLGESSSHNLEDFVNNFKNGVLSDKVKYQVENIQIIEKTEDYVLASWKSIEFVEQTEYYYAKKIGDKVFYAYKVCLVELDEEKKFLNGLKEIFNLLSIDDGKEPYIYDKVMNVPLVMNKKITNYNLIFSISNGQTIDELTSDYLDGSVYFSNDSDFVSINYGADGYYQTIDWTGNLNSKIKYIKEDNEMSFGIKDNNLTQILEINLYSDTKITNAEELSNYFDKVLGMN